jgi:tRNA 2-thiocytidine biosynthesis protein TtcA
VLPEGERLIVAVSGGIDSLAMAYLVGEHNRRLKCRMEITAVHVRLHADGATVGLPGDTVRWLNDHNIEVDEIDPRLDGAEEFPLNFFACARARRRTLLEAADQRGAAFVALGHHADDVVETWLLSLMYTGTPETIPAVRSYFDGAVTVVRPLYELQRGELARLARLAGFPQPIARCRREDETRREKVREALSAMGKDQTLVRRQLFWAAVRGGAKAEGLAISDAGTLTGNSKGE